MRRSFKLLTLGAVCAAALLCVGDAWAQGAPPAAASSEEIIVVAQRRSENIQDVPISVSAVTGQQIQSLLSGGGDVLQLASRVPGLNVESSNGRVAPRFYIRGLGNTDFDLAASQPVSVIMDDVVMENVALKSFPIFDIQQVEVLRGPQGSLFGRNTPAGIVNFRSVRPSQDHDGYVNASYGTFSTSRVEAAMGGGLSNALSFRVSGLYNHRDDWVDNGFTGANDALGGYDEAAGRVQILLDPGDNISALLNVHARSIQGTSTLFRANVFTTGSNELNSNFDRDTVFYDQGNNNPQKYRNTGASLTVNWDFGGMTLTSITATETADGFSLGDIDGGVTAPGPHQTPFPSATQDSLHNLDQFTQEFRLASADEGALRWQAGLYYFDASFDVTTVGVGFPPPATVSHSNQSWAAFAQASYDVTDALRLTGGVRYTDDDKDFHVISAPLYGVPPADVSTSDNQVSWDLSARYTLSDDINVYARVARGFRAPTIQGRDVAFGSAAAPSIADSETILSYEVGLKSDLWNHMARINADIFRYTIEDQQFSAIGGAGNLTQLVNADKGKAWGAEIETNFYPTQSLSIGLGAAYTHTEIDDPTLAVAPCGSGQCTVVDPLNGAGNALVDGNPFPQAPRYTVDLNVRWEHPMGNGLFFAETDWALRGRANIFLYDAVEFRMDPSFEGGARIGYAWHDGQYEAALFARNITDEENVIGAIDFNNNTGFVNEPRIVGISIAARMH